MESITQAPTAVSVLADLLRQKEDFLAKARALEAQIAEQRKAERSQIISKIRGMMAEHGIVAADLDGASSRSRSTPSVDKGDARKVAAKYRDPATGSTWTGRGLKPKWMTRALEEGKAQTDFLI